MTRRLLCITASLALCMCFGPSANGQDRPTNWSGPQVNDQADVNESIDGVAEYVPTAGAPRGGATCGQVVYDSLTLISGTGADITGGGELARSLGDTVTLAGTDRDICRVSVLHGSLTGAPYNLTLRIYNGCPVAGAALPDGACGALGAQIGGDFTVNVPAPVAGQYEEIEFLISPAITVPDTIALMFQTDDTGGLISLDAQVNTGSSATPINRCNSTGGNNGCNRNFGVSNQVGLNIQAEVPVGAGACCDTNTAMCTDVPDVASCQGAGLVFSAGQLCANITCDFASGACCTVGRICTNDTAVNECQGTGFTFFGDGSLCANNACPLECPPGHDGQVTTGGSFGAAGTLAVVSDRTRPLVAADNFVPVNTGQITSARWWGLYVDLSTGTVCADGAVPDAFQITYYASGSNGVTEFPGSIVGGPFAVTASKVNSGFGGFGGIYEYDATHAPVDVEAGFCYWIEISNVSDTVCEWLWFVAPPGDSLSAQHAPGIDYEAGDVNNDFDLGFCIDIDINPDGCINSLPVPGACCLITGGQACIDSDADACGAMNGTFLGGFSTCDANACVGACCLGENCQNETALQCETIFGLFAGVGTDCGVVDPCAPQACCDGAGFCSDLPQDLCESNGSAFFAGVQCADAGFFCPSSDILGTIDVGCNGTLVTNNSGLLSPEDAGFNPALNPNFSCAGNTPGAGEFWVSFTATDTSAFITTRNSDVLDTILEVHTGPDPFSLTPVPDSCADDDEPGVDFLSSVCIPTNIGDTYWVLVASFDNMPGEKGPITVEIICPCPATCDTCPGDLDGNAMLDGDDIQLFTSCLTGAETSPTVCVCADMDNDNDADIDDVDEFVAAILAGGFCPGFPLQECPPASQGQLPDLENGLGSNANEASGMIADNFDTPTGGTINTITWWGVYLGGGCPAGADDFTITIHNDDNNGTPGSVVANLTGQTPTAVATGRNLLGIADEYKYTLSGLSINLAPGCYWLKIGNSDVGGCIWFWSTSNDGDAINAFNPDGSGYIRNQGTDPAADDNDTAWCLSLTLGDGSTCTEPMGACCVSEVCQGNTTQADCGLQGGQWFIGEDCGAGFVCPPVVNGGDECIDAIPLVCNGGVTSFDSSLLTSNAGTDLTSSCEVAAGGPFTHDASAWFVFTAANTTATITMCGSDPAEDSVMTLFGADQACGAVTEFQCDDDFCVAPAFGPPQISAVGLNPGSSYLILVDFYSGGHTAGPHSIEITCP